MGVPHFGVRGKTTSGETMYYTGRSGEGWLSDDRAEAFTFYSEEGARRRADIFNKDSWAYDVQFEAFDHDAHVDALLLLTVEERALLRGLIQEHVRTPACGNDDATVAAISALLHKLR